MNEIPRRRSLTLVVLSLLALAAFPLSAVANHSWNGYHWARTANPFTLKVGDNLSSSWKSYLGTTSTDWSKSTVLDTRVVAGGSSTKRCAATSGRVEVCNGTYGNNGWLGVAQVWVSSSHITQGTVKVNDTYFNTSTYNNPAEKNHVMCQEVGHTLGLDHQDTSGATFGTCMDYSQSTTSQHPNQHDYDELKIIYQHLDSTTTVGQAPGSLSTEAANAELDSPGEWGKVVASSGDGKPEVYARDFRGGTSVFTFVYWTR